MKAYNRNLVFCAVLASAAAAYADNVIVCAPGIKDPKNGGTRTTFSSPGSIALVSDASDGKFYSYRVLGFYNQLSFPAGPWKGIVNDVCVINSSEANPQPIKPFPYVTKQVIVRINGFPLGVSDKIKPTIYHSKMRTDAKFYPTNNGNGWKFDNETLSLNIGWNNTTECGQHMFGYVNLKVEYIPEKPTAVGTLSAPVYAAETSLPSLDWRIVRQGAMKLYDPGHSTFGQPPVTDSPVVDNNKNDTEEEQDVTQDTTVGKNNNGHGNNLDGVDCSNPGQGKGGPNGFVDPSGSIDDEAKKK